MEKEGIYQEDVRTWYFRFSGVDANTRVTAPYTAQEKVVEETELDHDDLRAEVVENGPAPGVVVVDVSGQSNETDNNGGAGSVTQLIEEYLEDGGSPDDSLSEFQDWAGPRNGEA